jgi:hypothetical protein
MLVGYLPVHVLILVTFAHFHMAMTPQYEFFQQKEYENAEKQRETNSMRIFHAGCLNRVRQETQQCRSEQSTCREADKMRQNGCALCLRYDQEH